MAPGCDRKNRLLKFETEEARRLQARTEGFSDSWLGRKTDSDSRLIRRELGGSRLVHTWGSQRLHAAEYDAALGGQRGFRIQRN